MKIIKYDICENGIVSWKILWRNLFVLMALALFTVIIYVISITLSKLSYDYLHPFLWGFTDLDIVIIFVYQIEENWILMSLLTAVYLVLLFKITLDIQKFPELQFLKMTDKGVKMKKIHRTKRIYEVINAPVSVNIKMKVYEGVYSQVESFEFKGENHSFTIVASDYFGSNQDLIAIIKSLNIPVNYTESSSKESIILPISQGLNVFVEKQTRQISMKPLFRNTFRSITIFELFYFIFYYIFFLIGLGPQGPLFMYIFSAPYWFGLVILELFRTSPKMIDIDLSNHEIRLPFQTIFYEGDKLKFHKRKVNLNNNNHNILEIEAGSEKYPIPYHIHVRDIDDFVESYS